jgi:ketosteroid isomerase-like protein
MSQENVEQARRGFEAFNSRDTEGLLGLLAPDIEWDWGEALLGTPTYRGHAGIRQMLHDVEIAWTELRVVPSEDITATDDAVVWGYRLQGRGRTTGAPVEGHFFSAIRIRGGKAYRIREFVSRTEALEAVGLPEEDLKPN